MSESPDGPYTLWQYGGYEGWSFTDHATLQEAIAADRHTSRWVIQKPVVICIQDITEAEGEKS